MEVSTSSLDSRSIHHGVYPIAFLAMVVFWPPEVGTQTSQWTRQFGTTKDDTAERVAVDATGIYIVGSTGGALPGQTSSGSRNALVRKYDINGTELWTRQFGNTGSTTARGVAAHATGIYVVGHTEGTLPGQTSTGRPNAYVRKYDINGTEQWTRQFGTTAVGFTSADAVAVDGTGIYVAGATWGTLPGQTSAGKMDAYVRKYDSDGKELWTHQFGSADGDSINDMALDTTGVYVAGITWGDLPEWARRGSGAWDGFVRKYDAEGNELWTHQFGSAGLPVVWGDRVSGVASDGSAVYIAGGAAATLPKQASAGRADAFVRKYDADGNELWTRQFGSSDQDGATGVALDTTGIYIVGHTERALPGQKSAGRSDVFVRKYDANGNEQWTCQFGTKGLDDVRGVAADSSGIYVVGYTERTLPDQTNAGGEDAFIIKLTSAGDRR